MMKLQLHEWWRIRPGTLCASLNGRHYSSQGRETYEPAKEHSCRRICSFSTHIQPTRLGMLTEGPTDQEAAIIAKHFEYLQALTKTGVVILAGRTLNADESSFGMVILRAHYEPTARMIMEDDPAVKEHIMRAELYPYRVALSGRLQE